MMTSNAMAKTRESDESPVRLDPNEERMRRNLVRWIEESGYSVTEVADMAGVPQANLARYSNGKSALQVDALPGLARALGRASVDEFYSANPPPQRHRSVLELEDPLMAKARAGVHLTEQELTEVNDLLNRIRTRRAKQKRK